MRVDIPEYKTFVDFPDDTPPEQIQAVVSKSFPAKTKPSGKPFGRALLDSFRGAGANIMSGVSGANAATLETLDKGARRISEATGLPMKGAFGSGAKAARETQAYYDKIAKESGTAPESTAGKIYGGVGAAPLSIAEFTAGPLYAGAKGAMDRGVRGAVTETVKRAGIGKIFKGLEKANLSPVQRSGAMAGTMAMQTAAEGGSLSDVIAAATTGLALSAPGEGGKSSVVRQRLQKAGAAPEVAADLASRGAANARSVGPGYITADRDPNLFSGGMPGDRILNPERLPSRTDDTAIRPVRPERVADSEYIPPEVKPEPILDSERFDHDNLATAAVTGKDSLELQKIAPEVKPVVKMTVPEVEALKNEGQIQPGQAVHVEGNDTAYVIDENTVQGIYGGSKAEAVKAAKSDLTDPAKESFLLGYPFRPEALARQSGKALETNLPFRDEALRTAAVSKSGEVITDPQAIVENATAGNVSWAAEGRPEEVLSKAQDVATAIQEKGGEINGQEEGGRQALLTGQVDLHAGVHLPTMVKQGKELWDHYMKGLDTDAPTGSAKEFLDRNRAANRKFGSEPIKNKFARALIDSSFNVRRALDKVGPEGENARRQFDSIPGASTKALLQVENQRKALAGMSRREQMAMDDMIAIDRDLSIGDYKDAYKFMGGLDKAKLAEARENFQRDYKLDDTEMQRVGSATEAYFNAHRENTQRLLDAGMITEAEKAALDSHKYSPKQFLDKIDPDVPGGSGRITAPSSGIQKLKEGSDGYFRNNPMKLLSEATARIENRIAFNEANKALAELPEGNGIVVKARTDAPAPDGFESVSYMQDGKKQTLHMKAEFAKEWRRNDPLINSQLAEVLQWVSGAKIVRAGATGYNPSFVLTNVPRDMVTIWLQSNPEGYSKLAPKALGEMASDMKTVAGDAWLRKGRYVDYVREGGGRELLTHEGSLTNRRENLAPIVAKVQKTLSYVNEFSEILTRLAYRERLIKNGVEPATASKMAAEYLDFSRGGSYTKAIDKMGIPYLNAAIQGSRSIARAATQDPSAFAIKTAQLMVGAAGLYALNASTNPEGFQNVSDREKAGNFIIMLPKTFEYVDKNGNTVNPYIKISKEQSMRPFTTAVELALDALHGNPVSGKQVAMSLEGANPVALDRMPPVAAAMWTYILNADTFTKEPVWKGKQEVKPYAEYTANTNPALVELGKLSGLSPDRMGAALSKLVPSTNLYAAMAGNALGDMVESMNPQDRIEFTSSNFERLRKSPIGRLLGGAPSTAQYRDDIKEARIEANTKTLEETKELDRMVTKFIKTGSSDADLYDRIAAYVASQPEQVQERMERRIDDLAETVNLPDRGWWLATKALGPEDRADQFKARYQKSSPEEQQQMLEIADGLTGYVSERFLNQWEQGQ